MNKMKIFLIVLGCIVGWVCCSCLSALIAKLLDWDDGDEIVPILCVVIAPLFLVIELISIPFILLYGLIDIIFNL